MLGQDHAKLPSNNTPATTLVILAGGKATRMNGVNKLLQRF